jgi:hypothetical protein
MPLDRGVDITMKLISCSQRYQYQRPKEVTLVNSIKIGNRLIGDDEPCFIIAEVGVNHNGDINLAKALIDIAIDAGADAVKFQIFNAEAVVTKKAEMAEYQNLRQESLSLNTKC